MPTIKQLPAATAVGGTDLLPLSQGGLTRSVTVSTLLNNTQPLLSLSQGTILGRASAGLGGPEAINLGTGLALQSGALLATAVDHVGLSPATSLLAGDEVIVNSGAVPKRLPATQLRSLFAAGSGIQIDSSGTISATSVSQGGTSTTGPKGDTGAQGPAGQGFNYRGTWQPSIMYAAYDVVTVGGQTYVAASSIAASATFNATSWSLMAAQGSAGATGPSGAIGPAGPTITATSTSIGAVKPGIGLTISQDGSVSVSNVSLSSLAQGGASVGQLLSWSGIGWAATTPSSGVSYVGAAPVTVASGVIGLGQSGATTGQVLGWNGTGWTPTSLPTSVSYIGASPISVGSGVIGLAQNGATSGQVLTWSGTGWLPTTPQVGPNYVGTAPISVSSGAIALAQSGAVTGQVLTWSGMGWTPATPQVSINYTGASPISVGSGVIGISQNGATAGQVLTWNGTNWLPSSLPPSSSYVGTSSISVASGVIGLAQNGAATGQVLTWSGTAWIPQQLPASGASVGTLTPLANGVGAAGTAATASREDHRHPTDLTRAALAAPVFTTSITLPIWMTSTRPASPTIGMEGFASDTGRRETYTAAGWTQYVRLGDLPSASGQLLGGSGTAGAAVAVSIGSGLTLSGGTLSVSGTTQAPSTISGVSIDGSSIVASNSAPYQMAAADRVVDVNKTIGTATKLLLPLNPTLWVEYTVIDGKGDASTNNIVISGAANTSINGQATFTMNANNDAITFRAVSSTVWRIA